MSKRFTKIICVTVSAIAAVGAVIASGCGYRGDKLDGDIGADKAAVSNGGFAVGKGDYIYYINGVEESTADNSFGKPEKGAIYRVSKKSLKDRNYNDVQRVVPQIAYSSNYDTGIFIYGDRVYYGTPSTKKNAEGEVQNSYLEMKSSKLDGTETMSDYYVQFPSASYDYRYVQSGNTVYLLYVATDEKLYEETSGVKNLHSYNTSNKTDTVLAYNVDTVMFDDSNKENPAVYYTMNVRNYMNSSNYGYNQIYTVKADATADKFKDKLSSESVLGWKDGEDDETGDIYINCGNLVLDGVGKKDVNTSGKTIFNYNYGVDETVNNESYTYTLEKYTNGTLFYTRSTGDSEYLFSLSDKAELAPIAANPENDKRLMSDGASADTYKYIFNDGKFEGVIIAESGGGVSINKVDENGRLHLANETPGIGEDSNYFKIISEGTATLLFLDTDNSYLYYSLTGGNDMAIYRIDYSGTVSDYEPLQVEDTGYTPVRILDLDVSSNWYLPEVIDGYFLFASSTTNMTAYDYVMVFDMNTADGIISNAEIRALNEKYNGINKIIEDTFGDSDKYPSETYANVQNMLHYAFYNGDYDYLLDTAKVLNANAKEANKDANDIYSEETLNQFVLFNDPAKSDVWADYTDYKTINGNKVYANNHDYYYNLLGAMTEEDAEAYMSDLQSNYLVSYPEEEDLGWYGGLSTVAKVFFIIGMCLIGLIVIGGAVVLTIFLIKRRKKKLPQMKKKKIKVDTTDDKNIDVYSDPDSSDTLG